MNAPTTIDAAELLKRRVSLFHPARPGTSDTTNPVEWHLGAIRTGRYSKGIEKVRGCIERGDEKGAKAAKKSLPGVTWAGAFQTRRAEQLERHSGIMPLDFDKVEDPAAVRAKIGADPHTLAAWISASGRGVHALVAIKPTDAAGHRDVFKSLLPYYARMGLELDVHCSDVSRLLFLSHDPDMVWRSEGAIAVHTHTAILSKLSTPTTSSTPSVSSTSSISQEGVALALERGERVLAALSARHGGKLLRIYEKFVANRTAGAGERNGWVVRTIPAIYSVVSDEVAVELCLAFYDVFAGAFRSSRKEHEEDVRAMLAARRRTFLAELSRDERGVYDQLPEPMQGAFRICRDLASIGMRSGAPVFHLSAGELAARIDCQPMQAHRLLQRFAGVGLLEMVTKGTRHTAEGGRGKATFWKWTLGPLTAKPSAAPLAAAA